MKISVLKSFIFMPIAVLILGCGIQSVFAQTSQISQSSLYIPLIGITSVPEPLALPSGPGNVTYHYAVKNFLEGSTLTDVQVVDDKCSAIKYVEGDDNGDLKLDYNETWRYTCTTKLSDTTQSIATVTGRTNNITASHKAYATVVVGSKTPPPLVSIVNITKVAYPLSLPTEGGSITYTYKVTNPGVTPLSDVLVTDNKCDAMSGKLGDTNGNELLDIHEVWIYTCTTQLKQTTTNTVTVTAFANNLRAIDSATLTVTVQTPALPDAGTPSNFPTMGSYADIKIIVWGILSGILAILMLFFVFTQKGMMGHKNKKK